MPEVEINGPLYRVEIMEYERGWGSKLDEVKFFDSKEAAEAFCRVYNRVNDEPTVPDWYMMARYAGKVV